MSTTDDTNAARRGSGSNDLLGPLLEDWADAAGAVFHHGETLRGVSRTDLLQLMRATQAAERERCAGLCDAEFPRLHSSAERDLCAWLAQRIRKA